MPHGRVPIANGALRKADILAAAKSRNIRPANYIAFQNMTQQNEQLIQQNAYLHKKLERTDKLLLALYAKMGEEVPEEFLDCREEEAPIFAQGTGSSHAGSHPVDGNGCNNNGCNTGCGDGGSNNSCENDCIGNLNASE